MDKRGRPQLSPEEESRRLKLFHQGLTDSEMARELGLSVKTVRAWRWLRGLSRYKQCRGARGISMSKALPPEGRAVVLEFFRALLALREAYPDRRIDVTAALKAWREGLLQRGESA